MKWNKFVQVLTVSPWLREHVGSVWLASLPLNVSAEEDRRQLKEYVRMKLDYIAFRPSIDLRAHNIESFEEVSNPKYQHLKSYRGVSVRYAVRFHIEGPDRPLERLRYVEDRSSIAETLKSLIEWHGSSWGLRGCQLKLGAVVKNIRRTNEVNDFGREAIEIYPFPENFDLTQFKTAA